MASTPVTDDLDTPPCEDDRVLASAGVSGDAAALAEIARRLLPRARNLVRYLTRGDRDVEDLTQAALVEVLRSLASFAGRAPLEPWADRIVARHTRKLLAKRAQRERQEAPPLLAVRAADEPAFGYGARRDLARALDTLSDVQREALVLHHSMGLSVQEVADETGVSFDTAKSRLRLGITKLRALMGVGEGDR